MKDIIFARLWTKDIVYKEIFLCVFKLILERSIEFNQVVTYVGDNLIHNKRERQHAEKKKVLSRFRESGPDNLLGSLHLASSLPFH